MIKRKYWQILYKSVLLLLVFLLASEPMLVAAKPQSINPRQETIDALATSGDLYLTSVSDTLSINAALVNAVSAIRATPLSQLSENAVVQTRANALKAAESSAIALGVTDDLANSIQRLGNNLPLAFDPMSRANEGLPQELHDDLIVEGGLSSTDVDAISAGMDDVLLARQDMATNGMPAEVSTQLSQAGFTQSEIDQIATVASRRGLADTSLTTSMAQFRASQDEWATVRTRMLILNLQLMGYQIGVRQAHGIEPRPVTDNELQEITEDELRLLVHVSHIQELWGNDPNLDIGEGDWWFIEHFARRAAERLETLAVETHNRGLLADLFVLQEMRLLALSAKSGDASYAKQELDGLGQVLSHLVGDGTFISKQRDELQGLSFVVARLASHPNLRASVLWPIPENDRDHATKRARSRLIAFGVQDLTLLYGAIVEQNESNNMKTLLFVAGLPYFGQLAADIVAAASSIMSQVTPENYVIWVTAILTGDTDNPVLIAMNIGFSLIPVLGAIPDIYSLVTDPSIFVKALSVFGIIGSIGDLIGLLPFMQGVGGASFLGDAASAVIKALFKNADTVFKAVLNGLKLTDAFNVIVDFLSVARHYITTSMGSHVDDVIRFLSNLFTGTLQLWDDFVNFVRRVGAGTLLLMGFDEGSFLVGGIIRRGSSLSDEAIRAIDSIGDDLFEAGIKLSDNAKDGLGRASKIFSGYELEGFVTKLRSVNPDQLDNILYSLKNLDADGLLDYAKNFKDKVGVDKFTTLISKYGTDPNDLADAKKVFEVLGNSAVSRDAVQVAMNQSPEAARALAGWGDVLKNNDSIAYQLARRASKDADTLALIKNWSTGVRPSSADLIRIGQNSRDGVGRIWALGPDASSYTDGFADFARRHNAQFYYTHPEYGAKVTSMFPGAAGKADRDFIFWQVNEAALAADGGPIKQGMEFLYQIHPGYPEDIPQIDAIFLENLTETEFITRFGSANYTFRMREMFLLRGHGYELTDIDVAGNYIFK